MFYSVLNKCEIMVKKYTPNFIECGETELVLLVKISPQPKQTPATSDSHHGRNLSSISRKLTIMLEQLLNNQITSCSVLYYVIRIHTIHRHPPYLSDVTCLMRNMWLNEWSPFIFQRKNSLSGFHSCTYVLRIKQYFIQQTNIWVSLISKFQSGVYMCLYISKAFNWI